MTVQVGLCRTWSGPPKDRFSHVAAHITFYPSGKYELGEIGEDDIRLKRTALENQVAKSQKVKSHRLTMVAWLL